MSNLDTNYNKSMDSQNPFLRRMGVKQIVPLSPTLFDLCTDKLEEVVNRVVREEWLDGPKLMQHLILLLLPYDAILCSYDVDVFLSSLFFFHPYVPAISDYVRNVCIQIHW